MQNVIRTKLLKEHEYGDLRNHDCLGVSINRGSISTGSSFCEPLIRRKKLRITDAVFNKTVSMENLILLKDS